MGRATCHSREKVCMASSTRSYHMAAVINNSESGKRYETRVKKIAFGCRIA